ncbi:MAG: CBS domain-containing protein [Fuerstiella sp.]
MSNDNIEEEERIANEQYAQATEIIRGTIRELPELRERTVSLGRTGTVADALNLMVEHRTGAVLIMEDGKLYGLFTERDVITRIFAQGRAPADTTITDAMTLDPECLSYEHEIVFALNKMTVGGFRHVPILNDDGVPVAVLSMRHLVEHIVSYYSDEVYNLPPSEDGFTSSREGA